MATIVKTEAGTCKALVRKTGWPNQHQNLFRTKRDAEDQSTPYRRRNGKGRYIQRSGLSA